MGHTGDSHTAILPAERTSIDICEKRYYIGNIPYCQQREGTRPVVKIDMEKLRARLAKVKDQLPERVREQMLNSATVTEAEPKRKGVIMATLYILGASYSQIMQMFGVSKATVQQAVRLRIGPKIRATRPRYINKTIISLDQVSAYYHAAVRSSETDPLVLAKDISFARIEEDPDDRLV